MISTMACRSQYSRRLSLFYNKTMFENYGLMTPNEYYEMGEWNWETFLDVAEQLSVDFDYDGVRSVGSCGRNLGEICSFE